MSSKNRRLGRGLDAILGDVELAYTKELESGQKDLVLEIDIEKIYPNPYQPRKKFDENTIDELSKSIQKHGLIQPIIVFKKDDDYVLIAGERRLRATKKIGASTIKAIVADIGSRNLRELALIENIQRQDLNPIELANSYKELIEEYKITQEDLSHIIQKSRTQITNTMRLLNLTQKTQNSLINGDITQGHAKILVGLSQKDEGDILNTIIGQRLSVRDTEDLVKKLKSKKESKNKQEIKLSVNFINEMKNLKTALSNYGKIKIKDKKITIEFKEISNIQSLLEKFL
ncbi:ParB/RepB/Spo0J family partition protein [Campylobacter sp. FMV-PI01]|uniref:ParB/RepB/Spo0J family partition protein n=1 Tax=Campylobacter portucalensis TaxID=2608384 RepID=A0A6L5WJL4_9BACT|nr:ParB/RepB/Spo0J family partition protein [Campylobacter portucalensis]MSN96632.1 ParB/RepB/Spo0J family partition protein [Campylobacter portucalensis]